MEIGFKDDALFLLSVEEYEKYKDLIPEFKCWWWLRTPCKYTKNAVESITTVGTLRDSGFPSYVSCHDGFVRPALKTCTYGYKVGDIGIFYRHPFVMIDDGLWVSEVPIAVHLYDRKSNNYETSEIRQFILNWAKERK